MRTLTGHTAGVLAFTILLKGDLVSRSDDYTIKIWNPNNWVVKKEFNLDGPINALKTFSNYYLAIATAGTHISIMNTQNL